MQKRTEKRYHFGKVVFVQFRAFYIKEFTTQKEVIDKLLNLIRVFLF